MKLFKKYIISILFMFLMFGCTTRKYVKSSEDIDGFNTGKKGIVILQSVRRSTGSNNESSIVKTTWLNDNDKYFVSDPYNTSVNAAITLLTLGSVNKIWSNDIMIYFIEPGEYSLSDVHFGTSYAVNMKNIMSFNLAGGEIIYLGKIVTNDNYRTVVNAINIEDSYNDAVKYFKKHYPNINKTPTKRLIQFSNCSQIVKKASDDFGLME